MRINRRPAPERHTTHGSHKSAAQSLRAELEGDPPFYIWDEASGAVRWMCAWDTEPADVDEFAAAIKAALGEPASPAR